MDSSNPKKIKTIVYVCPVDHSGTSLFVKGWIAASDKSTGIPIILVHDLEESPEDYVDCAEQLAESGFNVYTYELRLQTRRSWSAPKLDFYSHSSDLLQVVAWIKHKESGRKPILVGQGLGALICLNFAQTFSKYISALVFVSPLFSLQEPVGSFKRFLLRTFAQVTPFFNTPLWFAFVFTESLRKESKKRKTKLPLYFTQNILLSMSRSHKLFSRLSLPTLILCPTTDTVCRYDFLKRLISKHRNEEKISLVMLDAAEHQVLTQNKEFLSGVFNILIPWFKVYGH